MWLVFGGESGRGRREERPMHCCTAMGCRIELDWVNLEQVIYRVELFAFRCWHSAAVHKPLKSAVRENFQSLVSIRNLARITIIQTTLLSIVIAIKRNGCGCIGYSY